MIPPAAVDGAGGGRALHVCLIAGEHSGDHMGAMMMRALVARTAGRIRFSGIGGAEMAAAGGALGFRSFFPMEEIAIGGILEVLPHVPRVLRRVRGTARKVRALGPDVLVTIDAPDFAFRVGKRLRGSGIPHVHYVAPTVWAWRPGRASMVAGFLSHLLTIFPFENPYFEQWGLPCTFVGHPTAEMGFERGDGAGFRDRYGLDAEQPLLCVLPGSRRAEVRRHLPVFKGTVRRLKARFPDLAVTVPTVATVRDEVASAVAAWPAPAVVTEGLSDKRDAFAAADLALAASGTVTYELAMAAVPMVITYRMSPLTVAVIRSMIRTKYVSVVNIVLGREVAPEFVQEACSADKLEPALAALLADADARRRQRDDLEKVASALGRGGPPPSETAAGAILSVIRSRMAGV